MRSNKADCTLYRAPVGQGLSGPDWLATALGFWSERALATGTAWACLFLIHHHHQQSKTGDNQPGAAFGEHLRAAAQTIAEITLFAHGRRENLTPPPLPCANENSQVLRLLNKERYVRLIQGAEALHRAGFCLVCFAKQAKPQGNPHFARILSAFCGSVRVWGVPRKIKSSPQKKNQI